MNLLDLMKNLGWNALEQGNKLGSQIRYGVSPTEKYQMLVNQAAPGMPKPFMPTGEENPEAVRYLSNYLGAQKWGEKPATMFNQIRYLLDNNPEVFSAGLRGAQAGSSPLNTMMARMQQ
jgi:hypothetical protein